MGRLKKDHSNYKTSGLWKKYQYPKVEERYIHKSSKNTKKWCKGKIGKKHQYELVEEHDFLDWSWKIYKCKVCGKKKNN